MWRHAYCAFGCAGGGEVGYVTMGDLGVVWMMLRTMGWVFVLVSTKIHVV